MITGTFTREDLLTEVGDLLRNSDLSIAVAESCTGGLLSHFVTNVSGSSDYFDRGLVTYSNRAKMDLLNVKFTSLNEFGAVSDVVAEEMANGVKTSSGTSIGLSTTGIAGPTGGTDAKPVGLVFVGLAGFGDLFSRRYVFGGDRLDVKNQAAEEALVVLQEYLRSK